MQVQMLYVAEHFLSAPTTLYCIDSPLYPVILIDKIPSQAIVQQLSRFSLSTPAMTCTVDTWLSNNTWEPRPKPEAGNRGSMLDRLAFAGLLAPAHDLMPLRDSGRTEALAILPGQCEALITRNDMMQGGGPCREMTSRGNSKTSVSSASIAGRKSFVFNNLPVWEGRS
ncbi:hypothetical protein J6590_054015 [Homalodisca vitripennis]|nr:hypothetical protein J6590_054015 [Homalodisca vitripennis]